MILDFVFDFDFVRLIQEMTKSGIVVSNFTLSITVKTLGIDSTCWEETNRITTRRKQGAVFWEPYESTSDERLFAGFSESLKMLRC